MTNYAKIRKEWRKQNLCGSCGHEVVEGKSMCKEHLDYHRKHKIELRADLARNNLCIVCGKEPPVPGYTECPGCQTKRQAKAAHKRQRVESCRRMRRVWVAKRNAMGLCSTLPICNRPVVEGETKCAEHLDPNYQKIADKRSKDRWCASRIANGLCTNCGFKNDQPGRWICTDCTKSFGEYNSEVRSTRRANGLCACGGKIRTNKARCYTCRDKAKRYARKRTALRRAKGICRNCSNATELNHTYCEFHLALNRRDKKRLKLRSNGIVLKKAA